VWLAPNAKLRQPVMPPPSESESGDGTDLVEALNLVVNKQPGLDTHTASLGRDFFAVNHIFRSECRFDA